MDFVKITLENDYDTNNSISNRILLRAYNKLGLSKLIDGDNKPFFYGIVLENQVYEYLTKRPINLEVVEIMDKNSFVKEISKLTEEEQIKLFYIIRKVIFNDDIKLDVEISTMKDLSDDRYIQFNAYLNDLTEINPYDKNNISVYTKKHNIL